MKDLYFIDGYNVIFCAPELFPREDLETARKRLLDFLLDFAGHEGVEIIAVFDGQGTGNKVSETRLAPCLLEIFTPAHMTADSYIEKESYRRRGEYRAIRVVSSDGPVQNQILGNGAYRMPVSELLRTLREDKRAQQKFIKGNNRANLRGEIGRNLPEEVRQKLDALRKGKGN